MKIRKLTALLLVLCMIFSLSVAAFAAEADAHTVYDSAPEEAAASAETVTSGTIPGSTIKWELNEHNWYALCALGEHQFCAVGLHYLPALNAHCLRHYYDYPIAAGCSNGGQAYAGIAGGGLDDHGAFLQQALGLGVVDHLLGNAVLHGTGRVEVLQLGQNVSRQLLLLFNVGELQQRGVADQLVSGSIDLAHNKFPPDTDTTSRTDPGTRGAARNCKPLNQHCLWV